MILYIIICLYFSINCFMAGWYLREDMMENNTWSMDAASVIVSVFIVLFGCVYMICVYGYNYVLWPLIRPLHIGDFWFLYFTKKWNSLSKEKLILINNRVQNSKNPIAWYLVKQVNKRNKYIHMYRYYTENPKGEFDCESDEKALKQTNAKFVYRESDSMDGKPFVILRYIKHHDSAK